MQFVPEWFKTTQISNIYESKQLAATRVESIWKQDYERNI
jgi:hypothetical protein